MKYFKYVICILLVLGLAHYVKSIGLTVLLDEVASIGYGFIVVISCYLLSTILATKSWELSISKSDHNISFYRLVIIRLISESVALINPTNIIGGDAMKVYYLKQSGISTSESVNSAIVSRVILILSQVVLMMVVGLVLFYKYDIINFGNYNVSQLFFYLCISIICFFGFYVLILKRAVRYLFNSVWKRYRYTYLRCVVLLKSLKYQRRKLISIYFYSTLHWLVGALELFFIFSLLGVDFSWLQAIIVDVGVSTLKVGGAWIPGQLGVEELSLKILLKTIGVASSTIWITVSIIRRARQLFWVLVGFAFFSFPQFSFNNKTKAVGSIIHHT